MSFIKTGSTLQIWNKDTKVAETTDITTQCQNQANLYIGDALYKIFLKANDIKNTLDDVVISTEHLVYSFTYDVKYA